MITRLFTILTLFPFFSFSQGASEIYLCNLKVKGGAVTISAPKNITNHPGYDNQPFFHPSQPLIYYASFTDSSQSDIKTYNYQTNITKNFTETPESEFSPTVTPDEKYISCIIQRNNGAQDFAEYPVGGGLPETIINYMLVGYHVWIDERSVLLFVLDDSTHNSLHYFNLITREDVVVAHNPGRSLHKIPGEEAVSFIEKKSENDWVIQKFNSKTREITTIAPCIPKHEDITWLKDGLILSSDGQKFFVYDTQKPNGWEPVKWNDTAIVLKNITRLAVNNANNRLAIVAE